jgi:hypothetical protein
MSDATDQAICDFAVWFTENKNRTPRDNVAKRLDFQAKAIDCLCEIVARLAKDNQFLERRDAKIILPVSVSLGDGHAPVRLRH